MTAADIPTVDTTAGAQGVEGNSRLTGMTAALLLMALAVEGATLLDVGHWMSVHAFIGLLVVPLVVVKLASTSYRMARYYLGDEAYRHRGPPHWLLRVLGPLVAISTVSLLATGVGLIAVGHGHATWLGDAHRASFIVWFAVMVIHVLGHLTETGRLAVADVAPSRAPRVRWAGLRASIVAVSLVAGAGVGVATIGWVDRWRTNNEHHAPLSSPPGR
jgi:hypothetical protein